MVYKPDKLHFTYKTTPWTFINTHETDKCKQKQFNNFKNIGIENIFFYIEKKWKKIDNKSLLNVKQQNEFHFSPFYFLFLSLFVLVFKHRFILLIFALNEGKQEEKKKLHDIHFSLNVQIYTWDPLMAILFF